MKRSELRIGNRVHVGRYGVDVVYEIDSGYDIQRSERDGFKPIPLTEEWLLKFGFNKTYSLNYEGRIMALPVIARIFTGGVYIETGGIYLGDRVKYVHEYQNLHFALCGQELEVKL